MYGWEQFRPEGLEEIDRLIKSAFFAKKTKATRALKRYQKLYIEEREAELEYLYHLESTVVAGKAEYDVAWTDLNELRKLLPKFYKSKEGKKSKYMLCFANHLHLGIEAKQRKKPTVSSAADASPKSEGIKIPSLVPIKETVLNFLKIFPEAWFFPKNLVARSTSSGAFNWDTIIFHVIALLISISIFFVYLAMFSFPPQLFGAVKLLRQEALEIIFSIKILFQLVTIPILTLLLWGIYKKVAKSSTRYLETLNYQFYFLSAWLPLLFWFLLANMMHQMFGDDIKLFLFSIFMAVAGLWGIWKYFQGISILMGVQGKKRFLPFVCHMVAIVAYEILLFNPG